MGRLKSVEAARQLIEKRREAARKKELRERVNQIKQDREKKEYDKSDAADKLDINLQKLYFSGLNSEQAKVIGDFCTSIQDEIHKRMNLVIEQNNQKLIKVISEISGIKAIRFGAEYKLYNISDFNVKKLNELGEEGWRIAYTLDDKIYMMRDVIVRKGR